MFQRQAVWDGRAGKVTHALQGARGHLHTQGGLGCTPERLRDSGREAQPRLTRKSIQFSLSFSALVCHSGT